MATVSTYLHFSRKTEEAFLFYKQVFGTEFVGPISRFSDLPPNPNHPIAEADKNLVMHIALPILGGHMLLGNDVPDWLGGKLVQGNNVDISLHPDSRADADRLHAALAAGGTVEMPMQDMFWGDYFGSCIDKFGINWVLNYSEKK